MKLDELKDKKISEYKYGTTDMHKHTDKTWNFQDEHRLTVGEINKKGEVHVTGVERSVNPAHEAFNKYIKTTAVKSIGQSRHGFILDVNDLTVPEFVEILDKVYNEIDIKPFKLGDGKGR